MSTASFATADRLSWTSPVETRPAARRAVKGASDLGVSTLINPPNARHAYGIDPAELVAYRRAAHAERAAAARGIWKSLRSLFVS